MTECYESKQDGQSKDDIEVLTNYNEPYKLVWSIPSGKSFKMDDRDAGVLLSNGKIGLISSFDKIDAQKMFITTHLQYHNGSYTSNTIEPFHVNSIKMFSMDEVEHDVFTQRQSMNMRTAILSSSYKVVDCFTKQSVEISVDLYTPRNIPYATMQTITVKKNMNMNMKDDGPSEDPNTVMLFHECYTKGGCLRDVTFNSNTIYHTRPNGVDVPVYILSGQGTTNKGKKVAFASTYVMEKDNEANFTNMGFNTYRDDQGRAFNKFKVDFKAKEEVTFHIFSSIMTDYDFEYPLDEVKKLVLSLYLGSTSPIASMKKIRSDHVMAWSKMWQTNLVINPKLGIPQELEDKIKKLNLFIKVALYNLLAASREAQKFDVKNMAVSILDVDGTIMNDGDLWLVPFMTLFKPKVAKNMLDVRYSTINIAQQIAGSYGFDGAKYPYNNSVSKISDGVLWNVINPISVFNTALIAINVWNYYRSTKDKDWLQTVGFPILKNVAEFIISIVEPSKELNDVYLIKSVMSLNGTESEVDNSFTNNKCKLALRAAIEASYDLSYYVKEEWLDVYFGLKLQYVFQGEPKKEQPEINFIPNDHTMVERKSRIIKFDANTLEEDTYHILEILFVLLPAFNTEYYQENERTVAKQKSEVILENINYYIDKIKTRYVSHPNNVALLTILYGMYAQFDEAFVKEFEDHLNLFTDTYVKGVWNNMTNFATHKNENSLNMNAIFLMLLTLGTFQARVTGSVSDTQFYSEEFGICLKRNANMPSFWKEIKATQIGSDKRDYVARNNTLFIASSQM